MAQNLEVIVSAKDRLTGSLKKSAKGVKTWEKRTTVSIQKVQKSFIGLKTAVAGAVAALTAGRLAQGFVGFADAAENVSLLSTQLGLSTEFLTRTQFAAEKANIGIQQMATGIQRASRRFADFRNTGTGPINDALQVLGPNIRAAVLQGESMETLLPKLADGFASITDEQEKVATAFKLFDAEGVRFLRFLDGGSKGLQEAAQKADIFGVTLTKKAARSASDFKDKLVDLKASISGVAREITFSLLDVAGEFVTRLTEFIATNKGQLLSLVADFVEGLRNSIPAIQEFGKSAAKGFEFLRSSIESLIKTYERAKAILLDVATETEEESLKALIEAYKKLAEEKIKVADGDKSLEESSKVLEEIRERFEKAGIPLQEFNNDLLGISLTIEDLKTQLEDLKNGNLESAKAIKEKSKEAENNSIVNELLLESEKSLRATAQKAIKDKERLIELYKKERDEKQKQRDQDRKRQDIQDDLERGTGPSGSPTISEPEGQNEAAKKEVNAMGDALLELKENYQLTYAKIKQDTINIAETVKSSFSGIFADAIKGTLDFDQALQRLSDRLIEVAANQLVEAFIGQAFGAVGGFFPSSAPATATAHSGGRISGSPGDVWARVQKGEEVISRENVQRLEKVFSGREMTINVKQDDRPAMMKEKLARFETGGRVGKDGLFAKVEKGEEVISAKNVERLESVFQGRGAGGSQITVVNIEATDAESFQRLFESGVARGKRGLARVVTSEIQNDPSLNRVFGRG